jgi:hypothetical protein
VTGRLLAPPPQLVHRLASSVCGCEDARKSSQQSQGEVSTVNGLGGGHKPQGGVCGPKENYSSTHHYDIKGAGE